MDEDIEARYRQMWRNTYPIWHCSQNLRQEVKCNTSFNLSSTDSFIADLFTYHLSIRPSILASIYIHLKEVILALLGKTFLA